MADSFLLQAYLDLGWHLFPIRAGAKAPITANGFKDASNDPSQIQTWLKDYPGCNWAVATGVSRLLVVDIDSYKGSALSDLKQYVGDLAYPVRAITPNKGAHLYYRLPEGVEGKSHNAILPAVDIRAGTGYVLVPPSTLENVGAYLWDGSPLVADIPEAPPQLIEFINNFKGPQASRPAAVGKELFIKAGEGRWEHIRRFAGRLRNWGWGAESIYCAISAFAETQCAADDTISDKKIRDLVEFICSRAPKTWAQDDSVVVEYQGKALKIPRSLLTTALLQGAKLMKEVY